MTTGPITVNFGADYDDYWWFAHVSQGVPILHGPDPADLKVGEALRRCCEACEVEWDSAELECWVCGTVGRVGWISRKKLSDTGVMVARHEEWVGEINRSCAVHEAELEVDGVVSMSQAED